MESCASPKRQNSGSTELYSYNNLQASAQAVDFKSVVILARDRVRFCPRSTDFDNNEGHVVGEGTVPPGSYTVEDRLLHIREC